MYVGGFRVADGGWSATSSGGDDGVGLVTAAELTADDGDGVLIAEGGGGGGEQMAGCRGYCESLMTELVLAWELGSLMADGVLILRVGADRCMDSDGWNGADADDLKMRSVRNLGSPGRGLPAEMARRGMAGGGDAEGWIVDEVPDGGG